ncbi:MAG: N-acetyltransferase [Anaerolineae bacterium]|jgi:GNAT superfamily N-acetyltransferase|nr:N-acetyltransferase [Chloroflexota bacterium]
MSNIQIRKATTKADLRAIATFPMALYRGDANYVPPLIADRIKHLDPAHNPYFDHAEMQLFIAERDGRMAGTIAAITDSLYEETWHEPIGFFGVFEVIEDYEVAKALLDAAGHWLAARGRKAMRGPMNLNINDECGLFIDGRDGPPVIMMAYNKPYYASFLERYGFTKAKDLHAFEVALFEFGPDVEGLPARLARVADIARQRYKVTVRPIDVKRLQSELELIKPIYRQAWAKNWGAVPLTDREFDYLLQELKSVVDGDLSYLAYIDDQVVGLFLSLPDVNQILPYAKGRLFPFGWAQLLLRQHKIDTLRVTLMGVLEEHRLKGIEALFYQMASRAAYAKGYRRAEMSWILEDNYKVIRGIEGMGGEIYRTYRIYDRELDALS